MSALSAVAVGDVEVEDALNAWEVMSTIRMFELEASKLYKKGDIPGFLHVSVGQEAVAAGACLGLRTTDLITSSHRGHGHCIAKGMPIHEMFAELMGKEAGSCGGRGGSIHIADPTFGVLGANGIVGAQIPLGVGAATAQQMKNTGDIVVAFFGDGAIAQGLFHEALNLAAVWDLPIVFLCENNHYAEFSRSEDQTRGSLEDRAKGYGIRYQQVDGNDYFAVRRCTDEVYERVRAGGGPVILEAMTYRIHGHYEGDPELYRGSDDDNPWRSKDPIIVVEEALRANGVSDDVLFSVKERLAIEVSDAIAWAKSGRNPNAADLAKNVYVERPNIPEPLTVSSEERFRTMDAVREALEHEMRADPSVFVAGIDVGRGGNVFGITRGMIDAYPGRVRDTPIAESAVVGAAVGAAMAGMKPVVEVMYMDFIGVCFDMLLNQAAKMRYMSGGKLSLPLVVRTQFGSGRSSGSQHSQSLEALLAHIPGLTVVMPSTPAETYGLLRAAIQDPNPVIFVENRLQYGWKQPRPPADHLIPIGKAKVVKPGSDVTLVSYSRLMQDAHAAVDVLEAEGVSVELIDLRTISPVDWATIQASLEKTNRLVVAHEGVRNFGVGAELAARAVDEGFWSLDAPVIRVGAPYTPAPYSPVLEAAWRPGAEEILAAVRRSAAA